MTPPILPGDTPEQAAIDAAYFGSRWKPGDDEPRVEPVDGDEPGPDVAGESQEVAEL